MKLGAEPKKIAILGGLLLVAGYLMLTGSSDDMPATTSRPAPTAPAPAPGIYRPAPKTAARKSGDPAREAKLRFGGQSAIDPTTIDPTLRLDLLAKVQEVNIAGGERNLFQFGAAPLPKTPEPKIVPKPVAAAGAAAADAKPAEPVKPPPPPIPLKFYGYASKLRQGDKRAFFLDGEDIVLAGEGDTIKRRYKVVRIGINSAVVEDTEFKHQQTLPLEEQAG